MTRRPPPGRRAFTIMECVVALAALAAAVALAAEFAAWAVGERGRTDARMEAVEAAANVLEDARARGAGGLTPEWAAAQKLPEPLAARRPDAALTARVAPEAGRPGVTRVTVEVKLPGAGGTPGRPVVLVGLFAARSAGGKS